jgi:hypothetical protein
MLTRSSFCSGSKLKNKTSLFMVGGSILYQKFNYLYNLAIALAAVFLTYGDMSVTASLIANNIIVTIIGTLMLDKTRNALARIRGFGSLKEFIIR